MLYLEKTPDNFVPWRGETINDVRHPLNIETLWTAAQLKVIGLYKPVPDAIPEGFRAVSSSVQRIGNVVREVFVTEQIPLPIITEAQVNEERDRRIRLGFNFNSVFYQNGIEDQKRITGAGALAIAAIMTGSQPGDYRWHGGQEDFGWIAANNTLQVMDAYTMLAFAKECANWESAHVFAARAIKDAPGSIPLDYTENSYWPTV